MKQTILVFRDQSGEMLANHLLTALPAREDEMIRKSIEYFADPAPCMIRRSAVVQRLYTELIDFLSVRLGGTEGKINWQEIPRANRIWIDLADPENVDWVEVRQIQKQM